MKITSLVRRGQRILVVSFVAAGGGCLGVKPVPLRNAEVRATTSAGREEAQIGVEPLTRPLTLEEALARALKYNLGQRAAMMEQAIALNVWKAGNFDMLPRALAAAGYRYRDNDLITRSRDSVTGAPSLAHPFISTDREYSLYDLGFTWSVLDLTTGYYTTKQNGDRLFIAAEHRRKAMHVLSRDVTIAFWRMASAQRLLGEVKQTLAAAEAALADAAQANAEGLRSPVDNLRYQRQLLENIRLLSNIEKEFATARVTLANLINAPVHSDFTVVEPPQTPNIKILDLPAEQLEEVALIRNAELREHAYNERIAAREVRKTLAKLFPNLSFNYNFRYSTDSYLINQTWNETGLQLSQNLTSLFSLPAQKRAAEAGVSLAHQRRLAAQMALLAQVHIARLDLAANYRQLELAGRIWDIDREIKRATTDRAEAQAESKLTKVAADTASIVSMLRRYQALAEFNAAAGALQSTLGLEIDLSSVSEQSLDQLTRTVAQWQNEWHTGALPASDATAADQSHP